MTETTNHEHAPQPLGDYSLAFVIDGKVQDVLHTDSRLAAIFLSEPQIVEVTDWYANRTDANQNLVGAAFDGAGFTLPDADETQALGESVTPSLNPSWVWSTETNQWEPPLPYPTDEGKIYRWDEPTISWVEVDADIETVKAQMAAEQND